MGKSNIHSQYVNIVKNITQAIVESNVIDYLYDVLQKSIDEIVYQAYDPLGYDRRGEEGGLLDDRFFDFEINHINKNRLIIKVYTNVKTNGKNKTDFLDEYVVDGDKYDWENSPIYKMQPFSRDFYEYAERTLMNDSTFKRIIKNALEKKGFSVKI